MATFNCTTGYIARSDVPRGQRPPTGRYLDYKDGIIWECWDDSEEPFLRAKTIRGIKTLVPRDM